MLGIGAVADAVPPVAEVPYQFNVPVAVAVNAEEGASTQYERSFTVGAAGIGFMTTVIVFVVASHPSAFLYDNVTFMVSLVVTFFFNDAVNPDDVSVCVDSSVVHVAVPAPLSSVVAANEISVPLQTSVSEAVNVLIVGTEFMVTAVVAVLEQPFSVVVNVYVPDIVVVVDVKTGEAVFAV